MGLLKGLEVAWEKGIRRHEVDLDSKAIIQIILKGPKAVSNHCKLISRIFNWINKEWQFLSTTISEKATNVRTG